MDKVYPFYRRLPIKGLLVSRGPAYAMARAVAASAAGRSAICGWPKACFGPMEVFRSEFMNGIRVAAAKPDGAAIAACTILFRAGSRTEHDDSIGVTHFLRVSSLLSGFAYSGYIKSRYLQQYGGYITVTTNREYVAYTLRCPFPVFRELKNYLLDTAVRCKFHQYELEEKVKPIVRAQLQQLSVEDHCMDLVQNACWAGPLGRSVYCPLARIDDINEATLCEYILRNFTPGYCSVASCGVPFDETLRVAEFIDDVGLARPRRVVEAPSYPRSGYETYHYGRGDTCIAFAVPTFGNSSDLCQVLTYAILAETLGTTDVQCNDHMSTRFPALPLGALGQADRFTSYKAFHMSYVDQGMFGIMIKTKSQYAKDAACKVAGFFPSFKNITCDQVDIGKKRLMLALCLLDDDCVKVAEGLALQCINYHVLNDAQAAHKLIEKIPAEAVIRAASTVDCNRNLMAMAVVGDTDAVPKDVDLIR